MRKRIALTGTAIVAMSGLYMVSYAVGDKAIKVPFPHYKVLDFFGEAAKKSLLDQPKEGKFSTAAIGSVHDVPASRIHGFKEIKALGKDYIVYSFLAGTGSRPAMPKKQIYTKPPKIKDQYGMTLPISPLFRIHNEDDFLDAQVSGHSFDQPRLRGGKIPNKYVVRDLKAIASDISRKVMVITSTCRTKGYNDYSTATSVAGHNGWVQSKAVVPTSNACYSCHTGLKAEQPVGHIVTFLLKRDK